MYRSTEAVLYSNATYNINFLFISDLLLNSTQNNHNENHYALNPLCGFVMLKNRLK